MAKIDRYTEEINIEFDIGDNVIFKYDDCGVVGTIQNIYFQDGLIEFDLGTIYGIGYGGINDGRTIVDIRSCKKYIPKK